MTEKRAPVHRKHIPMRTCVICRRKDSKRVLTRLVRTDAGVQIDPSGKIEGRGAYLCNCRSCWERAVNGTVLGKSLNTTLTYEDRERRQQAMPPLSQV